MHGCLKAIQPRGQIIIIIKILKHGFAFSVIPDISIFAGIKHSGQTWKVCQSETEMPHIIFTLISAIKRRHPVLKSQSIDFVLPMALMAECNVKRSQDQETKNRITYSTGFTIYHHLWTCEYCTGQMTEI